MKGIPDINRYLSNLTPARRAAAVYSTVFTVIGLSNYLFIRFRPPLYEYNAFFPETGVFMMYLWIILFLDEFLCFVKSSGVLGALVRVVKRVSLIVIACYALAALVLAINGISVQPVRTQSAKVAAVASPYRGGWSSGTMLVEGWNNAGGRREIAIASPEEAALYAGQDVEVALRKGVLLFDRVLEVRQDMEKYYGKMLKAAPDSQVALKGLTVICAEKGKFEEARKWYGIYTGKFADDDEVGTILGRRMIEQKQYDWAVAVLKVAISWDRGYENLYTLGYALAWAGAKQEAARYLQEATELDPADYRAFYSLGYVYRDTNQFDKARKAWSAVLTLIPNFPEVEKNLREIEQKI